MPRGFFIFLFFLHKSLKCPQAVSGVESKPAAHRHPSRTGAEF